ncbi:MAG: hypothetical protein HUJ95_06990 [Bacteroidales bacterium]|nr:hypothetical protein [Bacteroidales bacterium]
MKKLLLSSILLAATFVLSAQSPQPLHPNDGKQYTTDLDVTAKTYDRGLKGPKVIFSPKGTLALGVKVAYSSDNDNTVPFFGTSAVNYKTQTISVIPQIFYTFKHNHAIGLQFDWDRSLHTATNSEIPGVSTEKLTGLNYTNIYTGRIAYRWYNPIANSRRFALTLGGFLGFGGGAGQMEKVNDKVKTIYTTDNFNCSLYFSPGIAIAITGMTILEISLEVLGVTFDRTIQKEDGNVVGTVNSFQARFKPNILSLKLGTCFQIPLY